MLSVLVCGVTSPWVPVYERKSPPIVTFPFCAPPSHCPILLKIRTTVWPLCPDLHTGCNPPAPPSVKTCYPVGLVIWTSVWSASGCSQVVSVVVFILFLPAKPPRQCFQLNVQIVNNTAVALFSSLHVCLEEQHSPKDFKWASSPSTFFYIWQWVWWKESGLHPLIVGLSGSSCRSVPLLTVVLLKMALILASLELSLFYISFVFFFLWKEWSVL